MQNGETIGVVTAIYLGLGIILSIYPPIIQDKALGRICIFTAFVCLWMLWIVCYMSQMYPSITPEPLPLASEAD
ncbi:hypothetical protein DLAC_05300 [Tieghemostelium lacteum]|uniref:Uncharacterized protein n=1 Tax=Tieghemostelium lacteum TaxID=361077 RepID=A0A151ZIS1_TIELA|nr:hypothetical protein DLAC_05300 [Tieghemostelium lacteum]|eukprot:KYQ93898.1 hypothetical protein DLAC_05300 [Tieghemostelium lacteum]